MLRPHTVLATAALPRLSVDTVRDRELVVGILEIETFRSQGIVLSVKNYIIKVSCTQFQVVKIKIEITKHSRIIIYLHFCLHSFPTRPPFDSCN